MRWTWMPGVLLAAAIAAPSSAQISVHIGPRHQPSFMKNLGFLPTRDSFGSKDIGDQWATITSGCGDIGSVLCLKGRTGQRSAAT